MTAEQAMGLKEPQDLMTNQLQAQIRKWVPSGLADQMDDNAICPNPLEAGLKRTLTADDTKIREAHRPTSPRKRPLN